jgi:hypothetical protein
MDSRRTGCGRQRAGTAVEVGGANAFWEGDSDALAPRSMIFALRPPAHYWTGRMGIIRRAVQTLASSYA